MTKRELAAVNLLVEIWEHHRLTGIDHCDSCRVRIYQLLKSHDLFHASYGHTDKIEVDHKTLRTLIDGATE